jgi:ABC-type nitrate/sulfonate/bicarbonate transport system substrate-binding protein
MTRSLWIVVVCAALAVAATDAGAETVRVGKAQAQQFAFVPADIGSETGIFKQHGLDLEISSFAGDAKLLQALTAGAIDIALGGGPTLAFVAKGTPMLGIAALADAPGTIMLVVLKDGPIKTEDDLKGHIVSVSTAGSLTYWLAKQLSRAHGWGNDGINIAPLGTPIAQVAALKTGQIDGVVTDSITVIKLEEDGIGRILVRFGDRIKDFHVHTALASTAFLEKNPDAVRGFLAGWFESVRYMRDHKAQAVEIAARVTGVSSGVAARNFDELMPIFNLTGRFDPRALDVLATSFVEMGALPEKPDMRKLYTEQFLPQ